MTGIRCKVCGEYYLGGLACEHMENDVMLGRSDVADRYGMTDPASVNKAVLRGSLPKPDGYFGRTPFWWESTLDRWTRPGRTGRPRKER